MGLFQTTTTTSLATQPVSPIIKHFFVFPALKGPCQLGRQYIKQFSAINAVVDSFTRSATGGQGPKIKTHQKQTSSSALGPWSQLCSLPEPTISFPTEGRLQKATCSTRVQPNLRQWVSVLARGQKYRREELYKAPVPSPRPRSMTSNS